MEIHKHSHQGTHKKKWSEYLMQFLMLFLAVFLGFIAENIREDTVEHKRAKEMAVLLIDDLRKDTAEVHNAGNRLKDVIKDADAIMVELNKPRSMQNDTLLQLYGAEGLLHYDFFDAQMGTYEQIKNSGALRYFPQSVASKMTRYEVHKNYLMKITDGDLSYYRTILLPLCEKIENPGFLEAVENKREYKGACFNPPLDNETSNMLYKRAYHIQHSYTVQIRIMAVHEKFAIELINALHEGYGLKNE
jgi:hypothetical protein